MNEYRSGDIYFSDVASPKTEAATIPVDEGGGLDLADIGKGFVGGTARGVAGIAGLPGDAARLMRAGGEWIGNKLGLPPLPEDILAQNERTLPLSSAQVQADVEPITGKFYEPHTVMGQYASTLGEFAPTSVFPGAGSTGARIFNTVVPAFTSETAGQITKGGWFEPYARAIGGIGGGVLGAKLLTPTGPPTVARQMNVKTLENAGIGPLDVGQRTGSGTMTKAMAAAEDLPWAGGALQEQRNTAQTAYDRYLTEQMFDRSKLSAAGIPTDAHLPRADVLAKGGQTLADEYARLSVNSLPPTPSMWSSLYKAKEDYNTLISPSARNPQVEKRYNDLVDKFVNAPKTGLPGREYQAQHSILAKDARQALANNDGYAYDAFKGMQRSLDEAMFASLSPADQAAWKLNNQRYAYMKSLEGVLAKPAEHLSPQAVASALSAGRKGQYARHSGGLDEVADAAATVMKPFPQSGTNPRAAWRQMASDAGRAFGPSATGGTIGGILGGPMGAIIGVAAPIVGARIAVSRPGQAYLGNQVLPQRARDVLATTMMQQAIANKGLFPDEDTPTTTGGPLRVTVRPQNRYQ